LFGSLGFTEIAFILILALLLFGPKRLPEIGRTIGKGLGEFRRASNDLRRTLENEVALEEAGERRPAAIQGPPRPLGMPVPYPDAAPTAAPADSPAAGEPTASPPAARPVERSD
jgi:TatA/E family protein of Tat protein translocase